MTILAFSHASATERPPQRVVSINQCTDELALLLAQPGQLKSVSFLAQDPVESAYWREARAYPGNRGGAEEIIPLRPDLVLAGTYSTRATVALLNRLGVNVLEVKPAETLEEAREALRLIGRTLGSEAKAEALIAEMDARIDRAAARVAAAGAPDKAVLYRPGEGIAGPASLQGRLLDRLGIGNIAGIYGIREWADMSLEEFIQLKPDLIITSTSLYGASLHAEAARHPAFAQSRAPHVTFPATLTRCATPKIAEAAERIADGVATIRMSAAP